MANARNDGSDSAVIAFFNEQGTAITSNNKIKLLKSGGEKFDDLFLYIENAKSSIHLEYFNFRQDSIAGELFALLAKKASQGVKVRAIFDAFGNMSNNKPLKNKDLEKIREGGVEIEPFDPVKFPFLNHIFCRDHRKIAVIDGEIAYIGGINVADYYISGLKKIGEWRDMHIRIEGSAVDFIQNIFLSIWNEITGQQVGGAEYFHSHEDVKGKSVAIVSRTPRKMTKQLREAYMKSIASAQKNIQIVNPYFIPPHSVKKELKKALKRGVKLEIMISAKCDIKFTPDGVFDVAHRLMKHGADIYVYNNGFHHSKIMTVDSLFCTIGSANLDSRSLFFDYEANAFIFDREITDEISQIFEKDKTNSTLLTPEEWKKRSKWRRFVGSIANLLHVFL
ncbi:MAG: cardiolipin synthase [Prevotellaceae bacterium]|nr:cardiolipin synthase [Prevotellaceae bacterium]